MRIALLLLVEFSGNNKQRIRNKSQEWKYKSGTIKLVRSSRSEGTQSTSTERLYKE